MKHFSFVVAYIIAFTLVACSSYRSKPIEKKLTDHWGRMLKLPVGHGSDRFK